MIIQLLATVCEWGVNLSTINTPTCSIKLEIHKQLTNRRTKVIKTHQATFSTVYSDRGFETWRQMMYVPMLEIANNHILYELTMMLMYTERWKRWHSFYIMDLVPKYSTIFEQGTAQSNTTLKVDCIMFPLPFSI